MNANENLNDVQKLQAWNDLHAEQLAVCVALATRFEQLGIPYVIGGSLASSLWGLLRPADNVDVAVSMRAEDVGRFVAAFRGTFSNCEELESVVRAVVQGSQFGFTHIDTLVKVSVYVASGDQFMGSELARAQCVSVTSGARTVRVASAEDILLHKLCWYRDGGHTSVRQWADVVGILRVQGSALDQAYLDRWAWTLSVNDLIARARNEAMDPRRGG